MTTDNMSNEEVIEVLKGIVFNGFDRTTRKERQALHIAIKALKERPQGEWLEELKARREADRWIPVSERLPERNVEVIVTDIETSWTYSSHYCGYGYWECDNGTLKNRIIAWKPLPEPYKENDSG